VAAVYSGGRIRLQEPVNLPDGPLEIEVSLSRRRAEPVLGIARAGESEEDRIVAVPDLPVAGQLAAGAPDGDQPAGRPSVWQRVRAVLPAPPALRAASAGLTIHTAKADRALFAFALLIYLFTRLYAIDRFPIYFLGDEATHAVYAQDLLDKGFKDNRGNFLPIYFEAAGNRWTPLFSAYVHAISVALFGKSIIVVRVTSALVSLLAALSAALILKLMFGARYWWSGALLLAVAPAFFLHSRTGFETVMMSSFFACFLLCYLLYRTRAPRYLFPAILFGAATFYTYSNGQMIAAAAAAAFALSDIRYHLKHWRTVLLGLALALVLALPVIAFRATTPQFAAVTLRTMGSYWFKDLTLDQKLFQFLSSWAEGLSPTYWFIPSQTLLVRHRMAGYGNLALWLLPFFLIGVGWCLSKVRSPAPRAVLLAALATPVGAALVEDVGITRVLAFTIPASIFMALGIEACLRFIGRRFPALKGHAVAAAVIAGGLTFASVAMLRDALVNGPLWFQDYGLYGMQFGAHQLFEEALPDLIAENPNVRLMMTSTWANGTDTFIRFFAKPDQPNRVMMLSVDDLMLARREITPDMVFVMTPNEYARAQASGKFKSVEASRIVPYPNGEPGFYLGRLAYVDDLERILAQEREARSRPMQTQATVAGQSVQLLHSQLDMGAPPNLFDGDTNTLVRGLQDNPLIFEFTFSTPRPVAGLTVTVGSMDFTLTARLFDAAHAGPQMYQQTFRGLPTDPTVELNFDQGPALASKLRLEIQQLNAGVDAHIHVRELKLR